MIRWLLLLLLAAPATLHAQARVGLATGAYVYCMGVDSHPCVAVAVEARASIGVGPVRLEADVLHAAGTVYRRSLDVYQYGGTVSLGGELRVLAGAGLRQYRTFVGGEPKYLYARGLYWTVGAEWSRPLAGLPLAFTIRGQLLRSTFPTRVTDGTRTLNPNRTDPLLTVGIDWRL